MWIRHPVAPWRASRWLAVHDHNVIDAIAPVGRVVDEILRRSAMPERRDIR